MSSIFRLCAASIVAGATLFLLLSPASAAGDRASAGVGFAAVTSRHVATERALAAANRSFSIGLAKNSQFPTGL
jgi:hypothetical protein